MFSRGTLIENRTIKACFTLSVKFLPFFCSGIKVKNIFTCQRLVEAANFQSNLGNVRQLFHSSKAQNFLGIISRGLLLPKVVVGDYGGSRSDAGSLGNGIYFGLDASTSILYSSPGQSRGSRFMLICDVALGSVKVRKELVEMVVTMSYNLMQ